MSIGINQTNNYAGIDRASVGQITNEIFTRAAQKSNVQSLDINSLDLSKFKKADLGVDFYSNKTSIEAQREISIANSGINVNNTAIAASVYLNSQAAALNYANNTGKTIEGKIAFALNENDNVSLREVFALPKGTNVFNIADMENDKKGSNPFGYFESKGNKKEEKVDDKLSIFA